MDSLEHWNLILFHWINTGGEPAAAMRGLALFCAEGIPYLVVLGLLGIWVRGTPPNRAAVLGAVLTALLGLGVNQLIGLAWYHPRPFEMGVGHALMAHAVESSFPSDHATAVWGLGLALVFGGSLHRAGWLVVLAGLPVAWSRVYLGVHFPLDMVGALLTAALAAAAVHWLDGPIRSLLLPPAEALYGRTVRFLRLPRRLFTLGNIDPPDAE